MTHLILPITLGDLITMTESFTTRFPSIPPSPEAMQYEMSATLLRAYVGDEWCDRNLAAAAAAEPYLTPKSTDAFEAMKIQARVVALGEMVFNLQHVPGGRERVARIARSSLEVAVSDLEAARLLALNGHSFRFVPERGVKGADYDIELSRELTTLCCESKCKLEATVLSEATIFNSLRNAADQLPNDAPGVVFVKLPESWVRSSTIAASAPAALRGFFSRSGRTVEVVLHWEEWEATNSGGVVRLAKYREEVNKSSRFFAPGLVPLFRPWSSIWTPTKWIRFTDAIRQAHSCLLTDAVLRRRRSRSN
jgi:hypothetical protein